MNRRFREEEGRFIRCGGLGGSERGGPETGVATPLHLSRPPLPHPLDQTQWTFVQLLALEGTRSFLNQK